MQCQILVLQMKKGAVHLSAPVCSSWSVVNRGTSGRKVLNKKEKGLCNDFRKRNACVIVAQLGIRNAVVSAALLRVRNVVAIVDRLRVRNPQNV